MSMQKVELNGMNFEAETSTGFTLAFFWEPWDSSSRREWAILERVGEIIGKQFRIGTCSVEKAPELAGRLCVRSIPTAILIKDGKEQERLVGLRHKRSLIRHLKKYLEQPQ